MNAVWFLFALFTSTISITIAIEDESDSETSRNLESTERELSDESSENVSISGDESQETSPELKTDDPVESKDGDNQTRRYLSNISVKETDDGASFTTENLEPIEIRADESKVDNLEQRVSDNDNFSTENDKNSSDTTESTTEVDKSGTESTNSENRHDEIKIEAVTDAQAEPELSDLRNEKEDGKTVNEEKSETVALDSEILDTRRMMPAFPDANPITEESTPTLSDLIMKPIINFGTQSTGNPAQYGSKRTYPNELVVSHYQPVRHNPSAFLYGPGYFPHFGSTDPAPFNTYRPVQKYSSENRNSRSSEAYKDRVSNAYPYFSPMPKNHRDSNFQPYDVFAKLADASAQASFKNYPQNLFKSFDLNDSAKFFPHYNFMRTRRFTRPFNKNIMRDYYY